MQKDDQELVRIIAREVAKEEIAKAMKPPPEVVAPSVPILPTAPLEGF